MTHAYECSYCDTRDVALKPDMLYAICSVCDGTLDKIALCEKCGSDADDIDGEHCLSCVADMVRSGDQDIECMSEQLAKRVLAHLRKTPEPRIPQLMRKQAGGAT